ncbi:hypothetical protein TBLA_0J00580 [Henningerozyma blattae CBS 6284]|uniref:Aconitate hydratase, mitochondrial n=1 Tax=Henningerozyma blattae (strain ATCC 34711 / CBS 6284 / DSM 70876 / NBRC 10599 / NRRL Y-10934 / UCD 77-7) TaxID=1071380 RepID=I2H9K6_HENB6|nr:hypothetical protein TBLA_0J00580 [Tetrapisispora blattae CBS 6284]CCH63058.1 hypothetical protein TBLA_0J00580 [Tetrapisispora blattae CBS 6284]
MLRFKRTLATETFQNLRTNVPNYNKLSNNLSNIYKLTNNSHPLTLTEKILFSHLQDAEKTFEKINNPIELRGNDYLKLLPDRLAMQDASAQTAILQFITTNHKFTHVPTSIHCDHLIKGSKGLSNDLLPSVQQNNEVFDFLKSASLKFGIEYWPPNSGIIHQIVLENYSAPGLLMLGTDSHTPNAGGLGAIAIGVGGADAVDIMTGNSWELKCPKVMGIHLYGQLNEWCSAKDIILNIVGKLGVKGGTGFILEYFGSGLNNLSSTGMATICNMGAEVGATSSVMPFLPAHERYLAKTNRQFIVEEAKKYKDTLLKSDDNAVYDNVMDIDLSKLEPQLNGPFTPDLSTPISKFGKTSKENNWPQEISAALIGSCTNSSFQDMSRAANILKQAQTVGLKPKIPLYVAPGSAAVRETLKRDGVLDIFQNAGAIILSNACGPCIGQWERDPKVEGPNTILTSFNRNFSRRNDGNPQTHNFLTSPEIVTAMAFSNNVNFNPITDSIPIEGTNESFKFKPPTGKELPDSNFAKPTDESVAAIWSNPDENVQISVDSNSSRLELLKPFPKWSGNELKTLVVLKIKGKCTTDHISPAGPWLKYKGHLTNISENTLIGSINAETNETNTCYDLDGSQYTVPGLMKKYKSENIPWSVVGEHNYGEGSAREHAALSVRFLGGQMVLVKSFARIHETNLKKQGILPLWFTKDSDYDLIGSGDVLETIGLKDLIKMGVDNGEFVNGGLLKLKITKPDGNEHIIDVKHTMSNDQLDFFKQGSAVNCMSA